MRLRFLVSVNSRHALANNVDVISSIFPMQRHQEELLGGR